MRYNTVLYCTVLVKQDDWERGLIESEQSTFTGTGIWLANFTTTGNRLADVTTIVIPLERVTTTGIHID
jgi:hypothetical protein